MNYTKYTDRLISWEAWHDHLHKRPLGNGCFFDCRFGRSASSQVGETNSTDAATLQSLFFRNLTGQVVFPPGLLFLSSLQLIILLYSSAPERGQRMGKSNLMPDFQQNWGSLTMFFFLHVFVHTSSQFWPSAPSWAASWARLGIQALVGAVETS